MERNLQRVADYCALAQICGFDRIPRHTNRCCIAQQQLALGAAGLTVAKTARSGSDAGRGTARSAGGVSGDRRSEGAAAGSIAVAGMTGSVTVALDSLFGAQQLSRQRKRPGFGSEFWWKSTSVWAAWAWLRMKPSHWRGPSPRCRVSIGGDHLLSWAYQRSE